MITRLRSGREMELRAFALSDMTKWGWGDSLGINPMGERDMRGIPAINRAAQLRSQAIANLRLCCWSGSRDMPELRENVPQARLFSKAEYNDCQTRFTFWETVGESLAYRNKASIWKNLDPISGQVLELYALHPDQVECMAGGEYYRVTIMDGYVDPVGRGPAKYEVDDATLLFIRGHGQGGTYDPPTPIQVFRSALEGPIGRQRHEGRMWRRGTAIQQAIMFPQGVSSQQADEWRESYRSTYEGANGDTTLVLGGGADIKPIGLTPSDAQFVEMKRLTAHDAAHIMGVPANLLGTQEERPVPNLEQDLTAWLRFGLGPELARIESALEADQELFGNAQTWPGFETQNFIRGDVKGEADILVSLVQAGILTPDEARQTRGLDSLPGGVGATPQITPVGGAPNPSPVPAASSNGSGDY